MTLKTSGFPERSESPFPGSEFLMIGNHGPLQPFVHTQDPFQKRSFLEECEDAANDGL